MPAIVPSGPSAATSRRRLLGSENSTMGLSPSASRSRLTPRATSIALWSIALWGSNATARASSAIVRRLFVREGFLGGRHGALQPLVDFDRLTQRPCGSLEAGLHDVVAILAVKILDLQADAAL